MSFSGGWFPAQVGVVQLATIETQSQNEQSRQDSYFLNGWKLKNDTVDAQNPAPPKMIIIPLFIGL